MKKNKKCSTVLVKPEQKPTNEPQPIGLPSATILQNPMLYVRHGEYICKCSKHIKNNIIKCPVCGFEKIPFYLEEEIENNYIKALNIVSFELGIDLENQTSMAMLLRAIKYAKICNFTILPKCKDEVTLNKIFFIKTKSFYTIQKFHLTKKVEDARIVRQNEYFETNFLKMELLYLSLR